MSDHYATARPIADVRAGYFRVRLARQAFLVPAQICTDGVEWWAEVNGEPYGPHTASPDRSEWIERIWAYGREIDAAEHAYLVATFCWAKEHQPDHPILHPQRAVDPRLMPPIV